MKIVIVGAGVVGEELCKELSESSNDVILIEKNMEKLEKVIEANDITGLVGNGASYENLMEARVDEADIFIAVTEADELNIIACIMAKKMGAKYTIARVRNPEYNTDVRFARDELGISLMINPEAEAAKKIINKLKFPNAINVEAFFSNRANVIELLITEDSKLIGLKLRDIDNIVKEKVIVCVVKRKNDIFIPRGDFEFKKEDRIYVTGTLEAVSEFYNKMGYKNKNINSVMLIGGGIIPHYLTEKLLKSKKQVKIIESSEKRVESLSQKYTDAIVIKGSETDQEFLISEGLKDYDAIVALTDNDEENLVISMFAKTVNKGKIITKMSRTLLLPILKEEDFSTIVPKKIISDIIIRVVRAKLNVKSSKMNSLRRLFDTEVESIIFEISEDSKGINIPLKELKVIPDLLIACILRDEKLIYPGGNDILKPKDKVMIITLKSLEDFDEILEGF